MTDDIKGRRNYVRFPAKLDREMRKRSKSRGMTINAHVVQAVEEFHRKLDRDDKEAAQDRHDKRVEEDLQKRFRSSTYGT